MILKQSKKINSFIFMFSIALFIIGILLHIITNMDTTFIKVMRNNRLLNKYSYNEMLLQNKYSLNKFDYFKGVWLDFEVVGILLLLVIFTQDIKFKSILNKKMLKQKIKKEKDDLINYFY